MSEPHYFLAWYFLPRFLWLIQCFIFVPETTLYMVLCLFYIFVGLSFTTTIIELVRRQYAESWRKMQELRAQIQAQLKLANTLRQMADQAGKVTISSKWPFLYAYQNLCKVILKFNNFRTTLSSRVLISQVI